MSVHKASQNLPYFIRNNALVALRSEDGLCSLADARPSAKRRLSGVDQSAATRQLGGALVVVSPHFSGGLRADRRHKGLLCFDSVTAAGECWDLVEYDIVGFFHNVN